VGTTIYLTRRDGVAATLQAWDPVAQKRVWEVKLPGSWNPGTLTTAGNLVFQGRADGNLVAYGATSGAELWRVSLGLGITAPPITYAVNGRQYVALLVGWGGLLPAIGGAPFAAHGWPYGEQKRRLVAFSLEGTAALPPQPPPRVPVPINAPEFTVDTTKAARGGRVFGARCTMCHGPGAIAAGQAPDLRASPVVLSPEAFAAVVREGGLLARGMPRYAEFSDARLEELRHYIRRQASSALARTPPARTP
jgi:quinohemoprotein ethanol dehydrogenase